jgi:hypothetical protein
VPIIFPAESFVSNRLQQYRLETGSKQVKKGFEANWVICSLK